MQTQRFFKNTLLYIALIAFVTLSACESEDENNHNSTVVENSDDPTAPSQPSPPPDENTEKKSLRFIAVGDVGTGSPDQYRVADAMKNKCENDGCDFVLLLGDNVYNDGVVSLLDTQFQTKFEQPYQDLDVPFYVALGNHDYGGNGVGYEYEKSLFQIDYTGVSSKWKMPRHYYQFVEGNATFIALDTNGQMYGVDDKQRQEVSEWIAQSDSDWIIAFGHHPYKSNGPHGNAGKYEGISGFPIFSGDDIKSFAEDIWCAKADIYLSGHDHSRQWLDISCDGTALVISGAGATTTELPGDNAYLYQASTLGFLYVVIEGKTLKAQFLDSQGKVDFSQQIIKQ